MFGVTCRHALFTWRVLTSTSIIIVRFPTALHWVNHSVMSFRRRPHIFSALLIFATVFGFGWQGLRPREPVWKGKRLSAWLKDYDGLGPRVTSADVDEVVRQIGTNALPRLVSMLRASDSRLKLFVIKLNAKQRFVKF